MSPGPEPLLRCSSLLLSSSRVKQSAARQIGTRRRLDRDGPTGIAIWQSTSLSWAVGHKNGWPSRERHLAGLDVARGPGTVGVHASQRDDVEGASAAPLNPSDRARYRSLIAAFDGQWQLAFKVDSALGVGLELHGPRFGGAIAGRFVDHSHGPGR
jgi:hypothetical protein